MGRRNSANTGNYALTSATPITGAGFTMNAWLYLRDSTDYGAECSLMAVEANVSSFGTGQYAALLYDGANGEGLGAHIAVFDTSGGIANEAGSAIAVQGANTWNMLTGIFNAASLKGASVYLNGGGFGQCSGTPPTPSSWANIGIGALRSTTTTFSPLSGVLAECGLWNVVLTASEIAQLYQGVPSWRIRPESLVGYWLPRNDSNAGVIADVNPWRPRKYDATITGTLGLDVHPPRVQYPAEPKRKYWLVGSSAQDTPELYEKVDWQMQQLLAM